MPTPSSDTTIQRPELGQLVYEYMENAPNMGFIGTQVMPIFEVGDQSGNYPVIPAEALLSVEDTARANRAEYAHSDYTFEEGFYSTSEKGWIEYIDDRERNLYKNKFDSDAVAAMRAANILLRGQEKRIADMVFNSTNFTANSITNEWDDETNATPIDDIQTGIKSIRSTSGLLPNALIISYSTYLDLLRCDQIIDLIKYTFPMITMQNLSLAQLAQALGVEQVMVGGAIYNSAKKGQDASVSNLWSNEYAMLTKISTTNSITEPCIGRTFLWTDETASNMVVESYRDEAKRSDIIRVRQETGESLIASRDSSGTIVSNISQACSYLMDNITT